MQAINFYFNFIFNKIIGYTNPTIWTILVLILILFRRALSNVLIKIGYRIFDFDNDPDDSSVGKHLRAYMIFIGLYVIVQIWIKDLKFLTSAKTIFKVVTIVFATNVLVDMISPSGFFIRLSQKSSNKKFASVETNTIMNNFLSKIIRVVLYIIALALILNDLGYNINGMIAGLGIGSALMALAIQDTVKSFVSGASILAEKPFVIGDFVAIGSGSEEVLGTVEDVTLRNTKIRMLNNALAYVPNLNITNQSLVNYSRIENRRMEVTLQFPLNTTSEKLHRIMSKMRIYLESNPRVLKQTITIGFSAINAYSKDIRVYCYVDESKYKKFLEIQEVINFKIMEIIDSENISLAKPTQTLELSENKFNLNSNTENEFKDKLEEGE